MNNLITKAKTLDISNINSILTYGNEVMEEMKNIAKGIAEKIETKSDNKSFINSLNTMLNTVDYNELKNINDTPKNPFKRAADYLTKSKDKLIVKYTGIADGLDRMYLGIKQYQNNLTINNDVLKELQQKTNDLIAVLGTYINDGKEILNTMQEETVEDLEKKNLMSQKVQDLEYTLLISQQTLENISVMLKTNYTIYKKLISVYSTTIPIIQNQINIFKISKEHNDMIKQLKVIDEKRNELIKLTSTESVKLAKNSTELLGYSVEDFGLVRDAISILKQGMKEILELEYDKTRQIKLMIEGDRDEVV